MQNIELSIIIPVYNASKLLNRCLDSIFNQETQYSYEVILVDDGSSDNSVELIKARKEPNIVLFQQQNAGPSVARNKGVELATGTYCAYLGSSDNSVELIKARKEPNIVLFQQQNAGPSVARNKGVELATGTYCAYLDADDYWMPGFIEKTVSFLEEHKECVAVNVAQRHLSVSGDHLAPTCYTEYQKPFILDDFFSFWAANMHVCTGSVAIRTEVIRATGGMRRDLRITEDLEFWALISTYGRWGFIPELLFVSDGGDVTQSQGWLQKMEIRWKNAPSIADWEKRLLPQLPADLPEGYKQARGVISRNLTYCQLLSDSRWKNAPSIADWEKRLLPQLPADLPEGYKQARGVISRNLTYCQLLSDRVKLSRQEALCYGAYFKKDAIGKLMNLAKYTPLTWWMLAKFLKYREYHRKLK